MKSRRPASRVVFLICLSAAVLGVSTTTAAASAARTAAASGTYVKAYSAIVGGSQVNVYPQDVQGTSDGGSIALSETETSNGVGVDWLVKLTAAGAVQWQQEVGCSGSENAPGDNADGVSLQQTSDGGYVIAGGTVDCGSGSTCPQLSGQQCGLIEQLTSAGDVSWARAYAVGDYGTEFHSIRQTSDGGYIAAGSVTESTGYSAAFIVKLDSSGNVQWQQELGPATGTTGAIFNAVQQTSDGGYVAAGDFYVPNSQGLSQSQALVAKFTSTGTLSWQQGFGTVSGGAYTSVSNATSVVQTAAGGYAVAGGWLNSTFDGGNGERGALLLKLSSSGTLQSQYAYSGGLYCPDGDCTAIGSYAYSLVQLSGGGFVMAGDGWIEQPETVIGPWIAKVTASGNLTWQHLYYQTYAPTGVPLTENFQAAAQLTSGGFVAVGPTENYPAQKEELYVAQTNGSGNAGSCGDEHTGPALQPVSPELAAVGPALPVQAPAVTVATAPIGTTATSISTQTDC